MEASPATRLPEADALPDGFVESSSSSDQVSPISSAPAAGDSPHPALGPDHEAATAADAEETLGAPSAPSTAADALRVLDLNVAWEPEHDLVQQGPAADIGEAKDSLKESFVVEQAEPLPTQKESGEPKRKVVKRGSKLEKDRELLELAQRYHRVVTERDAEAFSITRSRRADAMAAAGETPLSQANYSFGRPWPEINEGLSYTDTFRCADAETTTTTLIDFYSENYKSSAPLPGWIHRIRNGQITVDGQVVTDPDTILREGSKLVYHRLAWQEPSAPHLLQVLYEDEDMVALNKPSGLQVLPKGLFQQRTVLAQLQWKEWMMPPLSCSKRKDVQSHPVPVHRLGRGTSGLLLCAKTKLAKVRLASYFAEGAINAGKKRDETEVGKERKISKFYRALVTGILENDEDVVTQPIGLVHYPGVAEGLYVACSSGKPAMSKVCVLEGLAHQNQSLVEVEIHSGRPHQIRIHLAFLGHPLVDDPLYGIGGQPKFGDLESSSTDISFAYDGGYERPFQPVPGDCGYHLHAHRLVLCHPTMNKTLKITAPLPHILQTQEERCGQQVDA